MCSELTHLKPSRSRDIENHICHVGTSGCCVHVHIFFPAYYFFPTFYDFLVGYFTVKKFFYINFHYFAWCLYLLAR